MYNMGTKNIHLYKTVASKKKTRTTSFLKEAILSKPILLSLS